MTEIRVLIADDHAVVRQGLRTFLELQDDIEVVADVADGEAALNAVEAHEPDVVLMDLVMPGVGGIEAIRRLRELRPETRAPEPDARSRSIASTPAIRGMTRSMRTTSGSSCAAARSAASPSAASPTTAMSSWSSRNVRSPCRTTAWSSAMRTEITAPAP